MKELIVIAVSLLLFSCVKDDEVINLNDSSVLSNEYSLMVMSEKDSVAEYSDDESIDANIVPADYDGDGKADLSILSLDGKWCIDYAVDGFGSWNVQYSGYPTTGTPIPADYDGDGKIDLSIKTSDGKWCIDYAKNGFGTWDVQYTGYPNSGTPVPADYDGDGKVDLSVRTSAGEWCIDYAKNGFGTWDDRFLGYSL